MKYEVNYHEGLFEVKTYGDAELEGFFGFWKELLAHEKWKPESRILEDHSELNARPFTASDIKILSERAVSMKNKLGNAKLAVVVSRDLEYGMVRMRHAYVDGNWNVNEDVFRSRDDAIAWLNAV